MKVAIFFFVVVFFFLSCSKESSEIEVGNDFKQVLTIPKETDDNNDEDMIVSEDYKCLNIAMFYFMEEKYDDSIKKATMCKDSREKDLILGMNYYKLKDIKNAYGFLKKHSIAKKAQWSLFSKLLQTNIIASNPEFINLINQNDSPPKVLALSGGYILDVYGEDIAEAHYYTGLGCLRTEIESHKNEEHSVGKDKIDCSICREYFKKAFSINSDLVPPENYFFYCNDRNLFMK